MKVSLEILKKLTKIDAAEDLDKFLHKVNSQLGGVEEVIDYRLTYKDALVVEVVKVVKHKNADSLNVCLVDDAGAWKNVERDENGYVQVVCGAPNVYQGMFGVWLPPNSVVPATSDSEKPLVLSVKEVRGELSYGMLASGDEMGVNNDHDGILDLDKNEPIPSGLELKAGASFAKVYGLDTIVIDIENKMFTHRPDCFGQLGVAREVAGIYHQQFEEPEWYKNLLKTETEDELPLKVYNESGNSSKKMMAVAMKNVEVKPSPMWLQCALTVLGSKPINNVVDVTNYLMLMTAQPMHAYDYDKLVGATVGVRMAEPSEKTTLLNDKSYELDVNDVVIVDDAGVIGLGGVMGGLESQVSENTKNIVIECANFDMYKIRRTAMRYGLFTDAVTRFTKGQSVHQCDYVLAKSVELMKEVAGGKVASSACSEPKVKHQLPVKVKINHKKVASELGLEMSWSEMSKLLSNVQLAMQKLDNENSEVCIPYWRTDLKIQEDIVEELGRLYGFDDLPRKLPVRSSRPAPKSTLLALKTEIRKSMASAGANELLTYSFVHENTIKNATQDVDAAYTLANALSPSLHKYRLTVLPSLLEKVHSNIKAGHEEFCLYELGKGHIKGRMESDVAGELPSEIKLLDMVYASKNEKSGAAYYQMQNIVQKLVDDLGVGLVLDPIDSEIDYNAMKPFDYRRSALLKSKEGDVYGVVGELKPSVKKAYKLPDYSAAASLCVDTLQKMYGSKESSYRPLSKYPSTWQDISLKVDGSLHQVLVYQAILQNLKDSASDLDYSLELMDVYKAKNSDVKTLTYRLKMTSHEKTLSSEDYDVLKQNILKELAEKYNAEVV